MGPAALAQVLRRLEAMFPAERFPKVLLGLDGADDAAVWRVDDETALIATTDFFTPIVDDPYAYGAIAAANALSDVYAVGGAVLFALNLCGFQEDLPPEERGEILRGGAEKILEAGGALVGGHTIIAAEPFYGLAVVRRVRPDRFLTRQGGRPGDALILTKPLGTGIIATAAKGGAASAASLDGAVQSMMRLNRRAAEALCAGAVRACTDVTGFGLAGHACEMLRPGATGIRLAASALPLLEGARAYAEDFLFPEGAGRNEDCYGGRVRFDPAVPESVRMLLFSPETSGGLLAAVPPGEVDALRARAQAAGESLWRIGEVLAGDGIEVAP